MERGGGGKANGSGEGWANLIANISFGFVSALLARGARWSLLEVPF